MIRGAGTYREWIENHIVLSLLPVPEFWATQAERCWITAFIRREPESFVSVVSMVDQIFSSWTISMESKISN